MNDVMLLGSLEQHLGMPAGMTDTIEKNKDTINKKDS